MDESRSDCGTRRGDLAAAALAPGSGVLTIQEAGRDARTHEDTPVGESIDMERYAIGKIIALRACHFPAVFSGCRAPFAF